MIEEKNKKLLHLLTHPIRLKALEICMNKGQVFAFELSKELNIHLTTATDHLKKLEKAGVIEKISERQIKTLYRIKPKHESFVEKLLEAEKRLLKEIKE
jgi:predicted ArsR family transcriptional regulator